MSSDAILPFPLWGEWLRYNRGNFKSDVFAALSVALLALPQSMAYAFVAGLPAQAGIFSAIFGTIFTASFGASPYLVSGPTTMVALLIQSTIQAVMLSDLGVLFSSPNELALSTMLHLVLLVGLIQIMAGFFKLGRVTQFASRSVIVGYMLSIAFAVVISQLYIACGIKPLDGFQPLIFRASYILFNLHLTHIPTLVLSLLCLGAIIILNHLSVKIPAPIIVFSLSAILVAVLKLSPDYLKDFSDIECGEGLAKVCLLNEVVTFSSLFPVFNIPHLEFRLFTLVFPSAVAIAAFSALEATSIGRSYLDKNKIIYNENQEVYGLGVSNSLSVFFGAMPSSGSLSRTTLNATLGAQSRFSAILSGIFVFVIVTCLGSFVAQIPVAALSALLFVTAYNMVKMRTLLVCLRSTAEDSVVVISTFFSSLLFSLDVALYVGIALSILMYLKESGIPSLVEYHFNEKGKLRRLESDDVIDTPICILQPEGELFFGAADPLHSKIIKKIEDPSVKAVILQLLNVRHLDASVCVVIQETNEHLKEQGKYLLLAGISKRVYEILEDSGLIGEISPEQIFFSNKQKPSEPIRRAYSKARELIRLDKV